MITSRFYEIVNSMNLKERRKEEDKEGCTLHGVLRVENNTVDCGRKGAYRKQTNKLRQTSVCSHAVEKSLI